MSGDERREPTRSDPNQRDPNRPAHPTRQAIILLVAVTLLIVVLAVASTF